MSSAHLLLLFSADGTRLDTSTGIPTFRRNLRWKLDFPDVGAFQRGKIEVFQNVFIGFYVFNQENWVLKRKRPRRQNCRFGRRKRSSAAEREVRPPNVAWFRMQLWPPKGSRLATYKSSFDQKWGVFSPSFRAKVSLWSPLAVFTMFFKSCKL